MDELHCPYCGDDYVEWVPKAQLYQCDRCGKYFEDDVPQVEHVKRQDRTKMHREE